MERKTYRNKYRTHSPGMKFCNKCNSERPAEAFYANSTTCIPCTKETQKEYRKKVFRPNANIFNKLNVLQYKGERCIICGYNRYVGALELHHRFPEKKHPRRKKGVGGWHVVRDKEELEFCLLLCANCHREIHAGLHDGKLDILLSLQQMKHKQYIENRIRILSEAKSRSLSEIEKDTSAKSDIEFRES